MSLSFIGSSIMVTAGLSAMKQSVSSWISAISTFFKSSKTADHMKPIMAKVLALKLTEDKRTTLIKQPATMGHE